MVGVAQLVEPRVVIPVVVGSSPIVHPNQRVKAAPFARGQKAAAGDFLQLNQGR
jgi:hypothetical protein